MGTIKIIDGGMASDEEVDAFLKGQGIDPNAPRKASDIQPRVQKEITTADLLPEELRSGEKASAAQVIATAMEVSAENFDLIGECAKIMRIYGCHESQINAMYNSPIIAEAKNRSTFTQRAALNLFWTQAIGKMGIAGMRYRRFLVSQGSIKDWLSLFKDGPVQFISEFSLPAGCGAPVKNAAKQLISVKSS